MYSSVRQLVCFSSCIFCVTVSVVLVLTIFQQILTFGATCLCIAVAHVCVCVARCLHLLFDICLLSNDLNEYNATSDKRVRFRTNNSHRMVINNFSEWTTTTAWTTKLTATKWKLHRHFTATLCEEILFWCDTLEFITLVDQDTATSTNGFLNGANFHTSLQCIGAAMTFCWKEKISFTVGYQENTVPQYRGTDATIGQKSHARNCGHVLVMFCHSL